MSNTRSRSTHSSDPVKAVDRIRPGRCPRRCGASGCSRRRRCSSRRGTTRPAAATAARSSDSQAQNSVNSRGLGLPGHRVPGAERAVAAGRRGPARPVGDQGAPEVDAVLDVLHVDVDFDLAAGHLDPGDATAPVDGRVAEGGPGPVDLLGQAPHRLVAVGRRARAQGPRIAQRADTRRAQAGQLRPLPLADDGRDRRVIGQGAQRGGDRPQVHLARDQGGGAVVERGERRPAGDPVVAVDAPCPPAQPRQQAHVAGAGLQPRAAPGPPGAFRALADPHRHHQQRDRRDRPGAGRRRRGCPAGSRTRSRTPPWSSAASAGRPRTGSARRGRPGRTR